MVQLLLHKRSFISRGYLITTPRCYLQDNSFHSHTLQSEQTRAQEIAKYTETHTNSHGHTTFPIGLSHNLSHEESQNNRICCLGSSLCSLAGEKEKVTSLWAKCQFTAAARHNCPTCRRSQLFGGRFCFISPCGQVRAVLFLQSQAPLGPDLQTGGDELVVLKMHCLEDHMEKS